MRAKGITYDTGFINAGTTTHEPFDPVRVGREMRIIRDDLHCTAVRVTGGDVDRLEIAAAHAADAGLEVWFSPFTCDLTTGELLDVLADCAARAERLRLAGARVVVVTGAELSLFTHGFLPGDDSVDRLTRLTSGDPALRTALAGLPGRINDFLGRAVAVVRERFGGPVSYAPVPMEAVDWTPFDFVGADVYRTERIAPHFHADMAKLVAQGKPVAITEFGCATFQGAAALGAQASSIIEWNGPVPIGLTGDHPRDEAEQATCLRELLDVFTDVGVDTTFVHTFAAYYLPRHDEPRRDLDRAGYGIVAVSPDRSGDTYPDLPWEPKAAFATVASYYA